MEYTLKDIRAMANDSNISRQDIRHSLIEDFKKECERKFEKSNGSVDP